MTTELEGVLSRHLGGRPVVAVANGTDALTLAVASLDLDKSKTVAVMPNAGGYGSIAVNRLGLNTVMVDVHPRTAQMDAHSLSELLVSRSDVGAVIITHLYGLCNSIEDVLRVCVEHSVPLVEDCAQSIGASVGGRWAGSFGDVAAFSFYPTKNLGALGDGGAVATKSYELARRVAQLAQYGWGERYQVAIRNGFNSRLDEIQAAILLERFKDLELQNSIRRSIVRRYAEAARAPRFVIFEDTSSFVGHLAILVTPTRSEDAMELKRAGISTAIHYPLLDSEQPAWRTAAQTNISNALSLSRKILTLPCFPSMTESEIGRVCRALEKLGS